MKREKVRKRETMFYLLQCPYLTFPLLSTVYETRMSVLFPHFSQNFFIGSLQKRHNIDEHKRKLREGREERIDL